MMQIAVLVTFVTGASAQGFVCSGSLYMDSGTVQYQAQQGVDANFAVDPSLIKLQFIADMNQPMLFMSSYKLDELKSKDDNMAGPLCGYNAAGCATGGMMCAWRVDPGGNNLYTDFHSSFANRCYGNILSPCDASGQARAMLYMSTTLQEVIDDLDSEGNLVMRLQRAYENPAAAFQLLKLVSQVPIEITIPVDFECTADDCIRVLAIVCTSFAGIQTDNRGLLAMTCKVPPQMIYQKNKCVLDNLPSLGMDMDDNLPNPIPNGAALCAFSRGFDPNAADVLGTIATYSTTHFTAATPFLSTRVDAVIDTAWRTAAEIPSGSVIQGFITIGGNVCQQAGRPPVTRCQRAQLYRGNYNLSLAQPVVSTLNMPIGVIFRTGDACVGCTSQCGLGCAACDACPKYPTWPTAMGQQLFLLRRDIEYGEIVGDSTGYLRVSPDVDGTKVEPFNEKITWQVLKHDANGDDEVVQEDAVGTTCTVITGSARVDTVTDRPVKEWRCLQAVQAAEPGMRIVFQINLKLRSVTPTNKVKKLQQDLSWQDEIEQEEEEVAVEYVINIGDNTVVINGGDGTITQAASEGLSTGKLIMVIGAVVIIVASLLGLCACLMIRKMSSNSYDRVQKGQNVPMSPVVNPQKTVFEDV